MAEHAQVLPFRAGQTIFKQDDPADGLYVLAAGEAEISSLLENGERQIITRIGCGEVFGELAVLDNLPRSATATAATAAEVYFIPRQEILQMFRTSPDVAVQLVKEITRRLREANRLHLREVLQAERLSVIGRFARSIVHDLKNPLAIMRMAAARGCAPATAPVERQEALGWIDKALDRVNSLVDDILEFTHQPPAELVRTAHDFSKFIESTVSELQTELALSKVVVECENAPPTVSLLLDPKRLGRVLRNLVINAVEAMADSGRVILRFRATSQGVTTEVQDTGPGLATEVRDKLFEPFATHGKPKGTGLGLAICRQIVEEHGGRITATNHPKGGAVFSFTLPYADAADRV